MNEEILFNEIFSLCDNVMLVLMLIYWYSCVDILAFNNLIFENVFTVCV